MTRAEFDALLARAVIGTVSGVDPASDDAPAAAEEAQLLEAEAREFADAVDRYGQALPYGDAVMLEGSGGVVVVSARTYADAPIYWRTVAGGELDRLIEGPELLEVLQRAANAAPAP